jgi:hypothetical protein
LSRVNCIHGLVSQETVAEWGPQAESNWSENVLSRVYGCVTNNNGVYIEWLDLLTPSFIISCGCVDAGRSLWQEDGSVVYNCCWPSKAQSFSGFTASGSRLLFRRLHTGSTWFLIERPFIWRIGILGNVCWMFVYTETYFVPSLLPRINL